MLAQLMINNKPSFKQMIIQASGCMRYMYEMICFQVYSIQRAMGLKYLTMIKTDVRAGITGLCQ